MMIVKRMIVKMMIVKTLKLSKENIDLKKKLNISLETNQKAKKNITKQIEKMKASEKS